MAGLADFLGVVARDPFYEFNTFNNFPNALNQTFLNQQFDLASTVGAGWLRFEFHVEFDQAPSGTLDFNKNDWFISEANRRGLKLLALLGSGIITNPITDLNVPADQADGTNPYIRAFLSRAEEICRHYQGQIAAWEILNEPNISVELFNETNGTHQEISPERYATLIAKVRRRFDALNNRAPVLIGGLLKGVPVDNTARYTTDYLESLYTSKPIAFYTASEHHYPWDGVCVHPYPDLSNPNVDMALQVQIFLQQMRAVMTKHKERGQIWITEIGWEAEASTNPAQPPGAAEQAQFDFMRKLLDRLLNNMSADLARLFWFKLEDFSVNGQKYNSWGLLRYAQGAGDLTTYAPGGLVVRFKPAFTLLRSYSGGGPSQTPKVT